MFDPLTLLIILILISFISGLFGSLTGLGGAAFLIPFYTLLLGIPLRYAAGASLISTIATSSGAGSAYVRDRITNVKIAMSLEIGTTLGSIIGALTAAYIYSHSMDMIVFILFGSFLISQVYIQISRSRSELPKDLPEDKTTKIFQLYGRYYDKALKKEIIYHGIRWWLGASIMFIAGFFSGLLGIGGGALKVLAMDWAMNLPMKVSTTTSNFMIGVTAATGSSIFWIFGYIQPILAGATAIGVLLGSFLGSKILVRITNRTVRYIFSSLLIILGIEMILKGLGYGI
jgi:uncharacterized membrane protein YfcA